MANCSVVANMSLQLYGMDHVVRKSSFSLQLDIHVSLFNPS